MHVTPDEFNTAAANHLTAIEGIGGPEMEEETAYEYATYYLAEMSPLFEEFCRSNGLFVDDTGLTFDLDRLSRIKDEAVAVCEEYDSEPPRRELWTRYDLGGDDDCDYNGGYILIAIDIINLLFGKKQ